MNLKKVVPVVASIYTLNESTYAPPEGITELIEFTNELLPEGIKGAQEDINRYKLSRKKALAQGIVAASTTAGVVVGAIPIPFADAAILTPIEIGELNALSRIYEINKDEQSKQLLNSIIEIGTVGMAAKAALGALKAIPGINIAASIMNAIIAGCFVAAIGEGSIYIFEQIYLGNKSIDDIDWITKILEAKLTNDLVDKVTLASGQIKDNTALKDIVQIIIDLLRQRINRYHTNKKIPTTRINTRL